MNDICQVILKIDRGYCDYEYLTIDNIHSFRINKDVLKISYYDRTGFVKRTIPFYKVSEIFSLDKSGIHQFQAKIRPAEEIQKARDDAEKLFHETLKAAKIEVQPGTMDFINNKLQGGE